MGRLYSLLGENLTLGTGYVLATIQPVSAVPSAGSVIAIRRVEVAQSHNTTSAMVRLALSSRNTAGTLTVTSATPSPIVVGGTASAIAGSTNALTAGKCGVNSSADSGGAYTDIWYSAPNVLNGWLFVPTPPEIILAVTGYVFCVRLLAAPGDTAGWDVSVLFEEIM